MAPEKRSDTALGINIEATKKALGEVDEQLQALGRGEGWARFAAMFGATEERLRAVKADLEKSRQNAELQIRAATAGMEAGAAAEYVALEKAKLAAGERWAVMGEEQRARLIAEARLTGQITQAIDDQRKAKQATAEEERKVKTFDRDIGGVEREIAGEERKQTATTMTASAATEAYTIEKLMLQAKSQGIVLDDERVARIKAVAAALGEATSETHKMQQALAGIQEIGRTVSSNLEDAFGKWIKGTHTTWKEFMNDMLADMAKLAFKQALMPLFGGGSDKGGGLFGQLLMSMLPFGGGKADGGPVQPGVAYQWQEAGREFFVPDVPGTVVPQINLPAMGAPAGGPSHIEMSMNVNIEGSFGREEVASLARQYAMAGVQQAVEAANAGFAKRQQDLHLLGS
jgi:hypothetical protein